MKNFNDSSRRRTDWFGVVGIQLPHNIMVHPALEDKVLQHIDNGGLAMLVDRYDGNFGCVWGFDDHSVDNARWHVIRTASIINTMINGLYVIENDLRVNIKLNQEIGAQVISLEESFND